MVQHRPSSSPKTLTIWLQYMLIGACAIPFALLTLFFTQRGMPEQAAFLIAVSLTLGASYSLWRIATSEPETPTLLFRAVLVLAFVPLVLVSAIGALIRILEIAFLGGSAVLLRNLLASKSNQPAAPPPPKHPISN